MNRGALERICKHLVVAAVGHSRADNVPHALELRSGAERHLAVGEKSRLDVVVAVESRDLLRNVGEADQIVPEIRRNDHFSRGVYAALEVFENFSLLFKRNVRAQERVDLLPVKGNFTLRKRVLSRERHDALLDFARAQFLNELSRPVDRAVGQLRVEALLESGRGFGPESNALRAAPYSHSVERRALENDIRRVGSDLGVLAAHNASDADRTDRVGNDEHVRVESSVDAVKRSENLALACSSDNYLAAPDSALVEGVHRLAELEHHVVCDVDYVVDRAHAGRLESLAHPLRRGFDFNVSDRSREIRGAEILVGNEHRNRVLRLARGLFFYLYFGHFELSAERYRGLSRKTRDAEAVRSVGGDLKVDDVVLVADAEHFHYVFSDERVEVAPLEHRQVFQNHDAVVDAALAVLEIEAELFKGTHHAVRDLTAELARFDFAAAGDDGIVERHGNVVAQFDVLRAGDDLRNAAVLFPHVHLTHEHVVGVPVPDDLDALSDDDSVNFALEPVDGLDLRAAERHEAGDVLRELLRVLILYIRIRK